MTIHSETVKTVWTRFLLVSVALLVASVIAAPATFAQECNGGAPNFVYEPQQGEECDDGNSINGDGCDEFCQIENTIGGAFPTDDCIDDVVPNNQRPNNCTANDVQLSSLTILTILDPCEFEGDTATILWEADFIATASERWDIGLFVAEDGGDARTGECFRTYYPEDLEPDGPECEGSCSITTTTACFKDADCPVGETCIDGYDPDSGTGPYYDGECDEDPADACGDIEQGVPTFYQFISTITCVDNDGDGFVDVGTCTSWDNARSAGNNVKPSCEGVEDVAPNTKAKCRCEDINTELQIPGTITVVKETVDINGDPIVDSQLFTFTPSWGDPFDLAGGDSEDSGPLTPGSYSVSETVPDNWLLISATCDDGSNPSSIHLGGGEAVICTFVNELQVVPPELTVLKNNDANNDGTFTDTELYPGSTAGDFPVTITYEVSITNDSSSDATIDSISDDIHNAALSGPNSTCDDLIGTPILAGETLTCTFEVTFANGDDPSVTNTTTVEASNAAGSDSDFDPSTVEFLTGGDIAFITLDKTADVATYDAVGDVITYTYVVTNTGGVTLTNVTLVDPLPDLGPISCVPPQPSTLDLGAFMTCTAQYTITQADLDNGSVDNTATADSDQTGPVDDTVTVTAVPDPAIDLVKDGALDLGADGIANPGDLINYTFSVENTGNVTLFNVAVNDPLVGSIDCSPEANPIADLSPGETVNCTASYAITQADIDAGLFLNNAEACGTDTAGTEVCDPDDHEEPIPQTPAIDLVKTGAFQDEDGDGIADAGETIAYTFTVTNTGNVTLTNVTLADTVGGVTISGGPIPSLAPGASDSTTFTGSYTITQTDIDAGSFFNTATATGECTADDCPVSDPDDHTEPLPQDPSIELVKTGSFQDEDGDGIADAGETIAYTFTVTNTGNVTLTNVTLADTVGGVTISGGPIPSLAPGASDSTTFTGSYTITQTDIDAGSFFNTATATGECTADDCPVSDPDDHTEPLPQDPSIDLVKTGSFQDEDGDGIADAGETIAYTFTVTNTGNVTLTNVTLADTVGGVTISGGPIPSLAPGASDSTTFTGSYTITQTDIDAGSFFNTATATGECTADDCPVSDPDDHTEPLPQDPSIDLVKTGAFQDEDGDGIADAGETIAYTFTVTNTGNVTLTNVTLADTIGGVTISGGPIPSLAPGASDSTTFTGSYTITQTDIDAGSFFNTATATGECTADDCPVSDPDDHTEPLPQDPSIDLVKTGSFQDEDGDGIADAGETIAYTFTVTNTGNVTLTNVTLADTVGGVTISGGPIPSLAPGASDSTTFTGSYTITQTDIDAGSFFNTATATGECTADDCPVSDPDDHTEPLPQDPSIDLVKTGSFQDEDGDGIADAGETIAYTFTVTNTGNVTLTNVTLADTIGGVTISGGPIPSLAPGASDSTTFTGSYTITQTDIDAGSFFNTATATGECTADDCPVSDPDDHTEPLPQDPSIDLVKTGSFQDEDGDGIADAGETIAYTFTVTNTGNVTLTNVTLADTIGGVTISGGPIPSLAPGASDSTTFTGSYTITQTDIDAGSFFNTATATGECTADDCPVSDPDDHTEPLPQDPSIELVKTGSFQDEDGDGIADAGETIAYTFTVTNTGNVTLTNVTLADTVGGVTISGGPIPSLAPGASDSTTFTGSYTITQTDIDAGSFFNTATATGECTADDCPVSDPDDHTEPLPQDPSIDLVKTGSFQDEDGDGIADAGETIAYTFTVTNTGNVTLTNVTLADTVGGVTISGGPIPSLAPGASDSTTFTGSYTITQTDIDAGSFFNTATATGECTADDCPVSDPDDHTEPLPQVPLLRLDKDGALDLGADGIANPGDLINYTFTVTNDGNVTLFNVAVTDPLVGSIDCSPEANPIADLAPGESVTCTGSYAITQTDIDAGNVVNNAEACGDTPAGVDPAEVCDPGDHDEPIPQTPLLRLDKDGALDLGADGIANPGDLINYTFTVTNDGNVTLFNVAVTDPLVGSIDCSPEANPIADLAPGESVTCTGSYAITQTDIDAGNVVNNAEACGDAPAGVDPAEVCDPGDHTEPIPQTPLLRLDKDGTLDLGADGIANPGDLINYTFTVTNDGNVTLFNVAVTDPLVGSIDCSPEANPIADLAPGESVTCTGSYAITQADIDAGNVVNNAEACGDAPAGVDPAEVCDPGDHDEPIPQTPLLRLDKDGTLDLGADGIANPGDLINYTFTVTNDGNVTLFNVAVTDPLVVSIDCSPEANPIADLAPGESVTCTGSYAITQTDIDAGNRVNNAEACGDTPEGVNPAEVCDPGDHTEDIPQILSLVIEKSTNGEDADAAPGPSILENEPVTWSYTVFNTGNTTLFNIVVGDDQGVTVDCGGGSNVIPMLGPGGSATCTASGTAELGQYTNLGTATGTGPNGQTGISDDDPSNYLGFTCEITVDKTCTVVPPPPGDFECQKPIDCLTMIWNGTEPVTVTAWRGDIGSDSLGSFGPYSPGDEAEICGFAGSPNNVSWEVFDLGGTSLGESQFHLSCSDGDMDGPEDCGNEAGDGKDNNDGFLNDWLFEGMVSAGGTLDCNPEPPTPSEFCEIPFPTVSTCEDRPSSLSLRYDGGDCSQSDNTQDPSKVECSDDPATGDACELADKPTALVFEYIGGDCSTITNDQDGKASCTGDGTLTGPISVTMTNDADKIDVTPDSGIAVGTTFEIARNDGSGFSSSTEFSIDDGAGNLLEIAVHTSCSQPLNVGDVFGPVRLVEFISTDGTIITLPPENGPVSTCETVFVNAFHDGDFYYDVTDGPVSIGGVFTIDASRVGRSDLDSEITFQMIDAETGEFCQEVTFHTSCSQDLRLGDEFGGLEVVGFTNDEQGLVQLGGQVNYFYVVTNSGPIAMTEITVVDDQGLEVICPYDGLGVGESMTCVASAYILEDTINNAFATGFVAGDQGPGSTCADDDSASVDVLDPPPCSIEGESTLKLDKKKLEWKLTNTGNDDATISSIEVTWPAANGDLEKVKFDGDEIWTGSLPPTMATLTDADWINDLDKRQIQPGDTDTFKLEFENDVDKSAAKYSITVFFEEGCSVTFDPMDVGAEEFECIKPIDCLTMIWQGPVSTESSDACDVGDPTALVFEYTGDDCSFISNTQEGKATCTDFGTPTGSVSIVMTNDEDKIDVTPINGVLPGTEVTIARNDGGKFASSTEFAIVDDATGAIVQTLAIHTSCSKPINAGDVFGPMTLTQFITTDGAVVAPSTDEPVENIRIKAWKGDVGSTLLADIDNVMPGDEIEVCGFAGSPNNVVWEIFEAGTDTKLGESVFHLSCSDSSMNGAEDCGLPQGNGKSDDSSLINGWILEGIVSAGGTLDCSGGSSGTDPTVGTSGASGDPATDVARPDRPQPRKQPFKPGIRPARDGSRPGLADSGKSRR